MVKKINESMTGVYYEVSCGGTWNRHRERFYTENENLNDYEKKGNIYHFPHDFSRHAHTLYHRNAAYCHSPFLYRPLPYIAHNADRL